MDKKIFVIFNTTSIGDVLVTNTLVRNIKYYYPDSYVVFVCNKPIEDVAKYQDGVDEVICYDKKTQSNLKGIFKFAFSFPYKKPFASFVTYSNDRNLLISRLIGAKHIISHHKFKFWNTKEKYDIKNYPKMKDLWGGMIEPLTGEHKDLPIRYISPKTNNPIIQSIKEIKNPVIISPTSNFIRKDMKPEDCIELINLMNRENYTPVMVGAGKVARDFADNIKKLGCLNFVDIVGCTSFVELAEIMKICNKCISVDTGTLHFACALNVPTVGIFYLLNSETWAPDSTLYSVKILEGAQVLPSDIMKEFKNLVSNSEVCV